MNNKTLVIAEAGVNHNGSVNLAKELVDAASQAGADIVKFQTFKAEKIASQTAEKAPYQEKIDGSQFEMLKKLEMDEQFHLDIVEYCKKKNIEFLSTAFDVDSLEYLLQTIGIKRIKIPSGEITNAPLLTCASKAKLPIIVSTGMALKNDIENALSIISWKEEFKNTKEILASYNLDKIESQLKGNVTILHCISEYPTPIERANLNTLYWLKDTFRLDVGYSDHTTSTLAPAIAVGMGAKIIEKHFTIDRKLEGPDHEASLEPKELEDMVNHIRTAEKSLGRSGEKSITELEKIHREIVRKSIMTTKPIKKGERLDKDNITTKRPAKGISSIFYWDYIGKVAERDYDADEFL